MLLYSFTRHPYKVFSQKIWERFFSYVFTTAFHVLFPSNKCYLKPKLQSIVIMIVFLMRAYVSKRKTFLKFLNGVDNPCSENCNKAQNLLNVFEFIT